MNQTISWVWGTQKDMWSVTQTLKDMKDLLYLFCKDCLMMTTLNKRRTCPNYYEWIMVFIKMPLSLIENIHYYYYYYETNDDWWQIQKVYIITSSAVLKVVTNHPLSHHAVGHSSYILTSSRLCRSCKRQEEECVLGTLSIKKVPRTHPSFMFG